MRTHALVATLLCAVFCAALFVVTVPARAQDREAPAEELDPRKTREEQVRRFRQLPAEEQLRLKQALERFRALPAAEREALRRKAKQVGTERLGELAGRDFEPLKRKHLRMQREMDEVMRLLAGPVRLSALTPGEVAYVRAEALRGFHRHLRVRMFDAAGFGPNFDLLPRDEKKERIAAALEGVFHRMLDEQPADERAAILLLPASEQRRERARLLADWRMREAVGFVAKFDRYRMLPLLQMPEEKRRALLAKRVRWFQTMTMLQADGAQPETLKMLRQLAPDERAQLSFTYEESLDLPVAERRARVEAKVRELYGKSAFEPDRPRRRNVVPDVLGEPPARDPLRERSREDAKDEAPK